jgi:hypothetical protein
MQDRPTAQKQQILRWAQDDKFNLWMPSCLLVSGRSANAGPSTPLRSAQDDRFVGKRKWNGGGKKQIPFGNDN